MFEIQPYFLTFEFAVICFLTLSGVALLMFCFKEVLDSILEIFEIED